MASKPRITAVQPVSGQLDLLVEWSSNKRYSVNLAEHIHRFPALKLLEDLTVFASVQVGEWGFDVTWGGDLEIASSTLWRLALEQRGDVMPTGEFKRWLVANQLSLSNAATELGFSRRTITAYSSGSALIPKHVALACRGWEYEHGQQAK